MLNGACGKPDAGPTRTSGSGGRRGETGWEQSQYRAPRRPHHDVEIQDESGRKLATANLPEGMAGIAKLHELIARHGGKDLEPADVVVGIETDRGSCVQALIASGYQVFAINPRQVNRFKVSRAERRSVTSRSSPPPAEHSHAPPVDACPQAQPLEGAGAFPDQGWPTWSASTGTSCGLWPGTARRPKPSRSSPEPTKPMEEQVKAHFLAPECHVLNRPSPSWRYGTPNEGVSSSATPAHLRR
ncbi:transposase [Streptomyces sp. NPDC005531]|uniref:IS110 family transposase n=1 Tax=Streptomyces sp. NPDC005531 TaxID=3364722 RepID=UPI0036879CDE